MNFWIFINLWWNFWSHLTKSSQFVPDLTQSAWELKSIYLIRSKYVFVNVIILKCWSKYVELQVIFIVEAEFFLEILNISNQFKRTRTARTRTVSRKTSLRNRPFTKLWREKDLTSLLWNHSASRKKFENSKSIRNITNLTCEATMYLMNHLHKSA